MDIIHALKGVGFMGEDVKIFIQFAKSGQIYEIHMRIIEEI